ncbi:hypothetical protein [Sphingomonas bacterium]|uniref:hypothetical protein n=1 Tax=Sphingomonas bacterium TaxID=1895847 RepID=UPI001576EE26|nr:hypothetical protein [Sphingomonas bacterium]
MVHRAKTWSLCAAALMMPVTASAQQATPEPAAILELGGAVETGLNHRETSYGPSIAAEFTPIEHVLEIEGGVTPLFHRGQTEWDVDLLFKKPWTLSDKAEFMAGIGPSWSHTVDHGRHEDSFAIEAALDFMFWPGRSRKLGWFVEPSYSYGLANEHEQSLAVSAGLLIPIGHRR